MDERSGFLPAGENPEVWGQARGKGGCVSTCSDYMGIFRLSIPLKIGFYLRNKEVHREILL